jgi:hypothetical protein
MRSVRDSEAETEEPGDGGRGRTQGVQPLQKTASMTGQSIATGKRITSRHHGARCVFRKTIGNGMKERKTNEYKENKGT